MIVLGIDPGLATLGWGVIETDGMKAVDYGVIKTDKGKETIERLAEIDADIRELIKQYNPAKIGMEKLYFFKNISSVIGVAQSQGVVMVASKGIPFYEYTPTHIKNALTGYGRAQKRQIQEMVKLELALSKIPRPVDAADALAAAICVSREGTHGFSVGAMI